jgi:hypothetical protein
VVRVRKETDHKDRLATARRVSARRVNPVHRDRVTVLTDHHVHHASRSSRHRVQLSRLPW